MIQSDTIKTILSAQTANNAGAIGTISANSLRILTKNSTKVTVDTGGSVGIGTTTPTAKLHVSGGLIRGDSLRLANYASIDSGYSAKSFTAPRGRFDSLIAPIATGNVIVRGRLNADTIASTKGITGTTGGFSGALSSTTLNTGNGANELYAMDQNVRTTDAVSFDSITVANKGIKIGSTVIDTAFYKAGTAVCSVYTGSTFRATTNVKYSKVGKTATVYIGGASYDTDSSGYYVRGVPSFLIPTESQEILIRALYNGSEATMRAVVSSDGFQLRPEDSPNLTGLSGFYYSTFTYILN